MIDQEFIETDESRGESGASRSDRSGVGGTGPMASPRQQQDQDQQLGLGAVPGLGPHLRAGKREATQETASSTDRYITNTDECKSYLWDVHNYAHSSEEEMMQMVVKAEKV